jgi:hypothetical protein
MTNHALSDSERLAHLAGVRAFVRRDGPLAMTIRYPGGRENAIL